MSILSVLSVAQKSTLSSTLNQKTTNDMRENPSFFPKEKDSVDISGIFQNNASSPLDKSSNLLTISKNQVYSFGFVDGKPLNFSVRSNGLIESNFSPMIHIANPGQAVSSYDMRAAQAHSSYSIQQQKDAARLLGRLNNLLDVADGKMSVNSYNKQNSPYLASSEDLLNQLGLNLSKSFKVNGIRFKFEGGLLKKI